MVERHFSGVEQALELYLKEFESNRADPIYIDIYKEIPQD